jgi:hypothetical protein
LEVPVIPPESTYTLPIWREDQAFELTSQYPNADDVIISYNVTLSLNVRLGAVYDDGFVVDFLRSHDSGVVGTDITLRISYRDADTSPWRVLVTFGKAYRIVDALGRSLVYVEELPSVVVRRTAATDYLSIQEAIDRMLEQNAYPFVSIAATSSSIYTRTFDAVLPRDFQSSLNFSVGGVEVTLPVFLDEDAYQTQVVSVEIVNDDSWNKCYVMYWTAAEAHLWLYGNGSCPY